MSADEMCGEQPCRHCGSCDGPPSCPDCDHADRPSVTDNARAVREAAMDLYRALRRTNPDALAEVDEVEDWTYWENIVRAAQVALAAARAETTTEEWPRCKASRDGGCDRCHDEHGRHIHCRAETTTATTEDTARAIHRALAPRWMSVAQALGPGQDAYEAMLADIAKALADAGLLATARTRPTRYEVARAIRLSRTNGLCKPGVRCDLCDCAQEYEDDLALRDADAVLALYADQPTEAEAGARALEQAAEWLRSDMDEPWGDRAANRLDVRAARIRAGGA